MRQVAAIEHVVRAMIMERRRQITAAITESGRQIFHSKTTRKPDFACIALLSGDFLSVCVSFVRNFTSDIWIKH